MDEGFYGAVIAEMNRRGEWITPYYNGHPWFEKPILLYWVGKPSIMLFGEWIGPRLPSVLATVGTYLLVAWFARRRWDDNTARWCVLITASSLLVVGVGRMLMTDALLNFCLVGAFVYFWESLVGNPKWRLLSAFFLGLSVLAKGPLGLLLFVPVVGWTYWREKDWRPAFRGGWLVGTAIWAVTVATWYVPAYLVNGHEFVQKFLIEQNLNRFTGGDPAHTLPFFAGLPMYFIVLLLGMAPWSFYLWKAWPSKSEGDATGRYLIVWALVPFIFFTISKAKLPHYVLPCAVPIALIVGSYLARRNPGKPRGDLRYPILACLVAGFIANFAFLIYYDQFHAEVHQLAFYVRDHVKPGEDVAAYQMPRRQHDLGTGKPTIQETSHPSLVMYLGRVVSEPDDMPTLLKNPEGQWVITRENRISNGDIAMARGDGRELAQVSTPTRQDHYRLYYLSPDPGGRTKR
jgi:4-amino-4-deoxy-L-arabinose transferase-like glycosyltransferase